MTMNQKLSAARAVRMPTLAVAMLANVMAPSTATSALTKAALVVLGSLLLAVSAQFKIPLYPVPVTGQTLVVLLIGMTYGPRLGGITMAAYLFEGAVGLPVFAGGAAGMAVLFGPTGGYLFGFLLVTIMFVSSANNFGTAFLNAFGMLLMYIRNRRGLSTDPCGTPHLNKCCSLISISLTLTILEIGYMLFLDTT